MYVFVDVDGTLVGKKDEIRPHVISFFWQVSTIPDVKIIVWSAGGQEYAKGKIESIVSRMMWKSVSQQAVDIRPMIYSYAWKQDWLTKWKDCKEPIFFIDDSKEMIEASIEKGYYGYGIPYFDPEQEDSWLLKAAEQVKTWVIAMRQSNAGRNTC